MTSIKASDLSEKGLSQLNGKEEFAVRYDNYSEEYEQWNDLILNKGFSLAGTRREGSDFEIYVVTYVKKKKTFNRRDAFFIEENDEFRVYETSSGILINIPKKLELGLVVDVNIILGIIQNN